MKYIITESQNDNLKVLLKQVIKSKGLDSAIKNVNGIDNLFRILDINSSLDFLNLFNDMDVVQSEEAPNFTLFRYKPKHNLMVSLGKEGYDLDIDYRIWEVLVDNFGLEYDEVQELTTEWLSDAYNFSVYRTHNSYLRGLR